MRKTLILAAMLLVVSACTTVGEVSRTDTDAPSVTAELVDTQAPAELPARFDGVEVELTESPAATVAEETSVVVATSTPAPEKGLVTDEPVPAVPLASPDSYVASLASASVVAGTATVIGNAIILSNSYTSPVTVNVDITYDPPNGYENKFCDSPDHTIVCQWVQHSDDPSNHVVPATGLGTGFTLQPTDLAQISFDVTLVGDDGVHFVTYGYNELPAPDFGQQLLTILLHVLSG